MRKSLAISLIIGVLGASPIGLPRVERVLGTLPIQNDTLRVVATVLKARPPSQWPDSSVESIRIVNRLGTVQHSDSMPPYMREDGKLGEEITVAALPITFEGGRGLRLDRMSWPSDPTYQGDCRYFALRGSMLVPVTPWCGACADLERGNLAHGSEWLSWFRALVPIRIHFERAEGGLELTPRRDRNSGLAVLEVTDIPTCYYEDSSSSFRVRLFRAPSGDSADVVNVSAASRIRMGRLYAKLDDAHDGAGGFNLEIRRLEIRVDGRHGFVESRDFHSLGLHEYE